MLKGSKANAENNIEQTHGRAMQFKPEEEKKISLTIINKFRRQRWVTVKWHLIPEEWDVSPCRETAIFLDQAHGGSAINYAEFVIPPYNEAWA